MTPYHIAAMGVRLFSIWFFLYSITFIVGYFNRHGTESMLVPISLVILLLAMCLFLWFYPSVIARRILPHDPNAANSKPLFDDWFTVGCSLIGLFALSKAIPSLLGHLTVHIAASKLYPTTFVPHPEWKINVVFNIFQVAFGLWLFLGGRGLKRIWLWARYS